MEEFATPEDVADRMVQYLFDGESPSEKRVLIPGCGSGSLLGAIERCCQERDASLPEVVAIEIESERLEKAKARHDHPRFIYLHRDFLSGPSDLGDFDYVLTNPPVVRWKDIDPDRCESYKYQFTTIIRDSTHSLDAYSIFRTGIEATQ